MTEILRRQLAPLSPVVWERLESTVREALTALLSARRVVEFQGPHGYEYSSVNLGRLTDTKRDGDLSHGTRCVLPLTEVKVDFSLDLDELDNLHRGALDVDLEPAREAARRLATFEESFIYHGFEPGNVAGILSNTPPRELELGKEPADYVSGVARAMQVLVAAGVAGPFALVLPPDTYRELASDVSAYPPRQRIAKLIEGPILQSQCLSSALLVSMRGGDFRLDVGQDVSVGYETHDTEKVALFLLETLTFRVLDADAALRLR